jgi:hypothetical protein
MKNPAISTSSRVAREARVERLVSDAAGFVAPVEKRARNARPRAPPTSTERRRVGVSCTTVTPVSALTILRAGMAISTVMLPGFAWVGSLTATSTTLPVSCRSTQALRSTVMPPTVARASFQKFAAVRPRVVSRTAWALGEFSRMVICGVAAYAATWVVERPGSKT